MAGYSDMDERFHGPIFWRISDSRLNRVHGEIISNIGQSYFLSNLGEPVPVSGDDAVVACTLYTVETDSRRRNREPFRSHSRYRRLNRILHVRLSYPAVLSCPGQRCPLLSNIHRAHVISSFLYPFSLPVYRPSILPVSPSVRAYSCSSGIFFEKYTKRLPFARQKFPFSPKRLRNAFKRVKCK